MNVTRKVNTRGANENILITILSAVDISRRNGYLRTGERLSPAAALPRSRSGFGGASHRLDAAAVPVAPAGLGSRTVAA